MKITPSKNLFKERDAFPEHQGKLYERVHYEDLKDVHYLSNTDIAHLIDKIKTNLANGIETKILNASTEVAEQLKNLDLEGIINFE
jgi:hypothetical protein